MGTSGNYDTYNMLVFRSGKYFIVEEIYQWSYTYADSEGWIENLEKQNKYKVKEFVIVEQWDKDMDMYNCHPQDKIRRDNRIKTESEPIIKKWKEFIESKITTTKSGFYIIENNPDDLTIFKDGKPILMISLPEQSTQWNTKLP